MIPEHDAYSRLASAIVTRAMRDVKHDWKNSFENQLDAFFFLLTCGDDYGRMLGYDDTTNFSEWLLMGLPMPKIKQYKDRKDREFKEPTGMEARVMFDRGKYYDHDR